MHQQINFYQEQFKEKKVVLSLRQLASFGVVLVLVLVGYSYFQQLSMKQLSDSNGELKNTVSELKNSIASKQQKINKILADNGLSTQITQTQLDIKSANKVLNFVKNRQFGSGKGFSVYLKALSRLSKSQTWLTKIDLSEDFMRLEGSSLAEEEIPLYFKAFEKEDLFKGMSFDEFSIDRPEKDTWKVNFVIASKTNSGDEPQ